MLDYTYPADEEALQPLRGRPVCVVLRDGSRHYGVLTSCRNGRLGLDGGEAERRTRRGGSRRGRRRNGGTAAIRQFAQPLAEDGGLFGPIGMTPLFLSERPHPGVLALSRVEAVVAL